MLTGSLLRIVAAADKDRCSARWSLLAVVYPLPRGQISQFERDSGAAIVATARISVDRNKMVLRLTRAQ